MARARHCALFCALFLSSVRMATCTVCPENSGHSLTQQTAESVCVCNAGYTGPVGGTCSACVAGKYREERTAPLAMVFCTASQKCGCPGSSSQAEGYFLSNQQWPTPGYKNSASCEWRIVASVGVVNLTFVFGVTEHNYDFVSVFSCVDATCTSKTLLQKMSGDCANNNAFCGSSTFSSTTLLVTFTSDGEWSDFKGFNASWKAEMVCNDCAAGKYSEAMGSSNSSTCLECPAGTYSSVVGASTVAICLHQCIAGYTGPEEGPCSACPKGTYKSVDGSAACVLCSADETTVASASTSESQCVCKIGFGFQNDECLSCLQVKYKDTEADSQCKDCPAKSSTDIIGATSVAGCLCLPGYTPFENQCIACVLGKYKSTRANEECVACPQNATTSANGAGFSDDLDHCYCNPGLGLLNNACSPCPSNTYWELYSPSYQRKSSRCASCPAYSRSVKGSISIEGCSCVHGNETYEIIYDEDMKRTITLVCPHPPPGRPSECLFCQVGEYTKDNIACSSSPSTSSTTPQPSTSSTTPEPRTSSTTPEPSISSTTPEPSISSTTPQPRTLSTTRVDGNGANASLTCGGTNCGSGCTPSSGASSGLIILGWPSNYENNANCWWLLAVSPGNGIQISFPNFDVEKQYDYIVVYRCSDASCTQSTKILILTGKSENLWEQYCFQPDSYGDDRQCNIVSRCNNASCSLLVEDPTVSLSTSEVFMSTTGFLKVTFASEYFVTARGFEGEWSVFSAQPNTSYCSTANQLFQYPAAKHLVSYPSC